MCYAIGLACCGQFSEDQLWYRAEVISVDSSTAHILFVDFGNSDRVPFSW
jgi:tudor domain-containing protein 1/4/6/7